MADEPIPVADLPKTTPGTLDSVVGVDESTGEAVRFGLSNLPASPAQAAQLQTYVDAAEAARDAAQLSAGVYADTTAGLAATTSGGYFSVPGASADDYLILYKNNAGSALEVKRYPSADRVTGLEGDVTALQGDVNSLEGFSYSTATQETQARSGVASALPATPEKYVKVTIGGVDYAMPLFQWYTPEAAIVILLGQSLNAPRGTTVQTSSWGDAYMLVDGVGMSDFSFYSSNAENPMNWASAASAVALAEGAAQTPAVGIAASLESGPFQRAYLCATAVGARSLQVLNQAGPRANVSAAVQRFCDMAVADGFVPKVYFYIAQGEANAAAATTEAAYYQLAADYCRMVQTYAAQAMGDPSYVAPVLWTYPIQTNGGGSGANDRAIKNGIRRVCEDFAGVYDAGPAYQWPAGTDRVHPTEASYVKRGEKIGRDIAALRNGAEPFALKVTGLTLAGTTFVATFNANVVRDATLGVGTNLNTSYAKDGMEWSDNGSYIAITNAVYSGNTITGTLAAAPVGTLAQQELRIASQTTTATLTAGAANLAGSLIRRDAAGWPGLNDPTYTNYDWAIPQVIIPEAA
jgi:hypothetical protein